MMMSVNVMVIAGLSNSKLISKIEPILENEHVAKLILVRKMPLGINHPKLKCYCPPGWLSRGTILPEVWRFLTVLLLIPAKKINLVIGIHYIMHCIYAGFAGLLFRVRYIFLIVENPKLYDQSRLFLFLAKRAFRIGVRGTRSKEHLISKGIEAPQLFIPPNIFDFEKVVKEKPVEKKYDLIFIGSFVQDKRVDILLQAIKMVNDRIPGVKAILIGEGVLKEEMTSLAAHLGIASNLTFAGYHGDVTRLINESRLLMLTSRSEGLPMVLVEAMACGLPCIVPDVGDISDIAIHEYNSMVVEPLNVRDFADAACRLLMDESLYVRLASNSLKIRQEKEYEYSKENLNRIWSDILSRVS